ncbi:MAG TPA: CBS domain-containing protein [Candidatus Acidoferrum sp.]|nr:CBS domain-containing protein [Candidatus Acidoferrum sp.]
MAKLVQDVVDRKMIAVSPDSTIESARRLAGSSRISILPVIEKNKLVGILDIESIEGKSGAERVRSAMREPIFVEQKTRLEDARKMIMEYRMPRLPVVESSESMRCIGTVSSSDLI